uniref:Putative metal-dependent hydrolase n=1 Tax=mine drainage metagenome TaxID=410659 RepID=E6QXF8_9ZZZZ
MGHEMHPNIESKCIMLSGCAQAYCLKRSRQRRTVALSVQKTGLVVYAPWAVPLEKIEQIIHSKADWVRKKLTLCVARVEPSWLDGMRLWFKGEALELRLLNRVNTGVWLGDKVLWVPQREGVPVQHSVSRWYQEQAMVHYAERVRQFFPHLKRQPDMLKLTSARTRWGSCTSAGAVRINWRLVQASDAEVDYVLAHELAHLTHLNHSGQFWREVARLYPDYMVPRAKLKVMGSHYLSNFG